MTNLARTSLALFVVGAVVTAVSGCSQPSDGVATPRIEAEVEPEVELPRIPRPGEFGLASHTYELTGPLVPHTTTMVTAWDLPQNPLTDATLDTREDGELIRHGFRLFTDTPVETPRYTAGGITCANCHLNSGQRELALPLVGSAGMFPEYNGRAGRTFSLEDRIVGCFYRSQNSVRGLDNGGLEAARTVAAPMSSPVDASNTDPDEPMLPDEESVEVVALAAYLRYLSEGYTPGEDPPWRRKNRIPQESRIAIGDLNPQRGEEIYEESCANCHGPDGQACGSVTRSRDHSGVRTPGTTAQALPGSTSWPASSGSPCPTWIPARWAPRTRSTSPRSSSRSHGRPTPTRTRTTRSSPGRSTHRSTDSMTTRTAASPTASRGSQLAYSYRTLSRNDVTLALHRSIVRAGPTSFTKYGPFGVSTTAASSLNPGFS